MAAVTIRSDIATDEGAELTTRRVGPPDGTTWSLCGVYFVE